MLPNEIEIEQDSKQVYQRIVQLSRCKFSDLQSLCKIENTKLCMALIYLLQKKRIKQEWYNEGVYYCI